MDYSAQRAQFAAEGYAVFERVLEGPLLDLLRDECGRVIEREDARLDALGVEVDGISHKGKRYFAGECQRVQPELRVMLFSETMADICRATLGDDAYFFYDQYVVKGADKGMPFSWHQDSGYVVGNGGPPDHKPYLTCWCTLDDTTVANGTVRILPFSQVPATRDGIVPHERQPGSNDLVGYSGDAEGVTLEVPAGSVVAFSSLALHATGSNTTPKMRRVYLAQYSPEPILNPGTNHLRRNAIAFLRGGRQVTIS
ncbi:phytanoyl-CoA dioxygenase family protein [Sphingomonas colocasiae]|uniref:Phytanoyl-CoA dioxygenase family protein n=1 Tax=Sphingomonas colocasiae TaxID=1848973 RepID=A0ABS7PT40_9SPHN|nr:phytanoyl-CoA dioxygenase family protein [Sphingomonas colocasiae]MBY8824514.1 phytanoyl-CoA dioxygenase family protein [Sphingomonas colocasiae]